MVHCTRTGSDVRVHEIVAVEELQTGRDAVAFTLTDLFTRPRRDEPLVWTGNLPVRAGRFLEDAGYDLRSLLDTQRARRPRAVSSAAATRPGGARSTSTRRPRPKAAP